MALIVRGNDQVFHKGSPVLAYWLAHSEGFRVRRRLRSAVVEGVYVQPQGRVTAISVRSRLAGRRRIVPADAVEAVVPAERLLLVGTDAGHAHRERLAAYGRLLAAAAVALARAAVPRLEALARAAVPRLEALARAAVPRLEALARLGARIDLALLAALRRGFTRVREGDAARRWLGMLVRETTDRAGELRSAISRCSWFGAAGGSDGESGAESAPAGRSSSHSSSS